MFNEDDEIENEERRFCRDLGPSFYEVYGLYTESHTSHIYVVRF